MDLIRPEPNLADRVLSRRSCLASWCLVSISGISSPLLAEEPSDEADPQKSKQLFSGKVVFVREALAKRGIKASGELDGQVALETSSGELFPIVPDWRGRAFFQDERLRGRQVDLIAFKEPESPYLQVLTIYAFDERGTRLYVDYWCEICAIPMYEIQQCQCCQGDIELRFQPRDLPEQYRLSQTAPLRAPQPPSP